MAKKYMRVILLKKIDMLNPHLDGSKIIVKFENGGFNICEYYGYNDELTKWFYLEIIGNIYQNPE